MKLNVTTGKTSKVRGRHADRTAAMRQRLIDAAIVVLGRFGYSAMTTQSVIDEAGVSRGAILHHFPTKIDLVVAVARYAAEAQNRYVRRRLAGIPPGIDLFMAITEATWDVICQPPGLALLEIIIAARSDRGLDEQLPQVVESFQNDQMAGVWAVASELGVRDQDAIERMVRLNRAAMRGLAMEMIFSGNRPAADEALELLVWYKRALVRAVLPAGEAPLFQR